MTLTLLPSSTTFSGPPRSAVFAVYAAIKSPQQILLTFSQRKKERMVVRRGDQLETLPTSIPTLHFKSRRFFANFFLPDQLFF
jgi:hypothetical protein